MLFENKFQIFIVFSLKHHEWLSATRQMAADHHRLKTAALSNVWSIMAIILNMIHVFDSYLLSSITLMLTNSEHPSLLEQWRIQDLAMGGAIREKGWSLRNISQRKQLIYLNVLH